MTMKQRGHSVMNLQNYHNLICSFTQLYSCFQLLFSTPAFNLSGLGPSQRSCSFYFQQQKSQRLTL